MFEWKKKIFPKHESLARSFDTELSKKNSGLLYILDSAADDNDNVAGYVMFSLAFFTFCFHNQTCRYFQRPFWDLRVKVWFFVNLWKPISRFYDFLAQLVLSTGLPFLALYVKFWSFCEFLCGPFRDFMFLLAELVLKCGKEIDFMRLLVWIWSWPLLSFDIRNELVIVVGFLYLWVLVSGVKVLRPSPHNCWWPITQHISSD